MRHTVYTQQHYADDGVFAARMELARRTSIPAMLHAAALTHHPVRWAWQVRERHEWLVRQVLEEEGWTGEIMTIRGFAPFGDDVQSTLDSDDRIEPGFLATVQGYYRPDETFIVTWQPVKQDLETGDFYRHRRRYAATGPSMFYAVYNPTDQVRVYAKTHERMHWLAPTLLATDAGAIAVIHGANALATITEADIPLGGRA